MGNMHRALLLPLRLGQSIPANLRKNMVDMPSLPLLRIDYPGKGPVGPDHPSILIQQCIGNLQLLQKLPLDLSVLGGKANELTVNLSAVIQINNHHSHQIDNQK